MSTTYHQLSINMMVWNIEWHLLNQRKIGSENTFMISLIVLTQLTWVGKQVHEKYSPPHFLSLSHNPDINVTVSAIRIFSPPNGFSISLREGCEFAMMTEHSLLYPPAVKFSLHLSCSITFLLLLFLGQLA